MEQIKFILCSLVMLFLYQVTYAQSRPIAGRVFSAADSLGLGGVTITIKTADTQTSTTNTGDFSIQADVGATLVFSFVGYESKELTITANMTPLAIFLDPSSDSLDEVVVIGYGTIKRSDLTGSVSTVTASDLRKVPVYNSAQSLKGRASGVDVKQNSGNPTGRIEVRIRGANSMIGSNNPLYVVDGVPLSGGIEYISPSDIETMDILKDASSTAIYGARGANGVVIITTKQGKREQTSTINVDSYYGMQSEIKRYDVLNSSQYATIVNEYLKNGGLSPFFDDISALPNTDWQDAVFRNAPVQNHTLTFSGGDKKTTYSLSGDYYVQDGIIKNTSAKKGSMKISLRSQLNNIITAGGNIILTRRETFNTPVDNGAFGKTTLSGALAAPPTLPIFDENGVPTRIETAYSFGSVDMRNPTLFFEPRKDRRLMDKMLANANLDVKLGEGLIFKTLVGIEYFHGINDDFVPVIYPADLGSAADGYDYENSVVTENTLNYKKDFNEKHAIDFVGGFTYQKYMNRGATASVTGLATNVTENLNLGGASTINTPSNYFSEWSLLSWLGRANYSYKGKYLFTASVRADGSSRFGENQKWGVFPSGAFAWKISEEEFVKSVTQITDLKLRMSYGLTGNTALSPYQSLSRLSAVRYISADGRQEVGWSPSGISNANLRWETTRQVDIGFDLAMFNNRLSIVGDYYHKLTSNLLASVPLPPSLGFTSTLDNLGEIENQGVELSVSAGILNSAFKWDIVGNISANRNKVKTVSMGSDIESGTLDIPFYSPTNLIRVDEPFGLFFGYREDGLDDDGLIKYHDLNGDGEINALDRTIIGNPYPDFIFSISNNFSYKNWDLNVFLDASQGNDIFWATAGSHLNSFQRGQNQFVDIMGNYWTAENPNPNAKYPAISSRTSVTVSDRFIEDGSYIRLRNVTLGYTLPIQQLGLSWFRSARFYVSGINLLTFTNYPGLDPESNTVGTDSQNVGERARLGIDQGGYPTAKSVLLGLNISF